MKRGNFIELLTVSGGAMATASLVSISDIALAEVKKVVHPNGQVTLTADVVVAGGGLGGFAAAMASLRNNQSVILTEETDWLGGQLTSQGVPPDEHEWIETYGATQFYRDFRTAIRAYYKRNYPLIPEAKNNPVLNPGDGVVSRLCHEPMVALAVMNEMIAPYLSSGKLQLLLEHRIIAADVNGNKVKAITAKELHSGEIKTLVAPYFVDATELGELLPLTGTEFVTGTS